MKKEDKPLLTVSMRTALGKYMMIMRMVLPNERKLAFKWIISFIIPTLLLEESLQQIKVVMTDGDVNQIVQLEEAIKDFMPGCYQQGCGWHIIFVQQFKKHTGKTINELMQIISS